MTPSATVQKNGLLLLGAAASGQSNKVRALIPISDATVHDCLALSLAALEGHAECVALLIPVSDPKIQNSKALRWALEEQHTTCAELLYSCSDITVALNVLRTEHPDRPEIWQELQHRVEAEQQNTTLQQSVGATNGALNRPRSI